MHFSIHTHPMSVRAMVLAWCALSSMEISHRDRAVGRDKEHHPLRCVSWHSNRHFRLPPASMAPPQPSILAPVRPTQRRAEHAVERTARPRRERHPRRLHTLEQPLALLGNGRHDDASLLGTPGERHKPRSERARARARSLRAGTGSKASSGSAEQDRGRALVRDPATESYSQSAHHRETIAAIRADALHTLGPHARARTFAE